MYEGHRLVLYFTMIHAWLNNNEMIHIKTIDSPVTHDSCIACADGSCAIYETVTIR